MSRGRRRTQIRFEKKTETADGGGGVTITWEALCTEWAFVERVQSFRFDVERIQSGAVGAYPTVRLHVDSHSKTQQIDNTMRAVEVETGKTYSLNFVQDLTNRGRTITITATEGAPA
jgi:head-tail adaptor